MQYIFSVFVISLIDDMKDKNKTIFKKIMIMILKIVIIVNFNVND